MGIRLVVSLEALPGKLELLLAQSAERAKEVREQPGCIEFSFFQDIENPDRLVLLEKWADQEALETHWEGLRARPAQPVALRQMLGMETYSYDDEGG